MPRTAGSGQARILSLTELDLLLEAVFPSGASLRTVQRVTGHASLGQLQNDIDVAETDELTALLRLV